MSLVGWLSGETKWGDEAPCVDRAIRRLCIFVNDYLLTDEDRERVIGPHVYAVMGTNGYDYTRREILSSALEALGGNAVASYPTELLAASIVARMDSWVNKRRTHPMQPFGEYRRLCSQFAEFVIMPLILKLCESGVRIETVRTMASLEKLQS